MRRLPLLLLGLLSSVAAMAQDTFSTDEIDYFRQSLGRYQLVDGKQGEGLIEFIPGSKPVLVVEVQEGQFAKYTPADVRSFVLEERLFISTSDKGEAPTPANAKTFTGDFLQLLDSGEVILARRYKYLPVPGNTGLSLSANLVVRRKTDKSWTRIPHGLNSSTERFRKVVAPLFVGRNDLLDALSRKVVIYENLERCIHAYNTGASMNFAEE